MTTIETVNGVERVADDALVTIREYNGETVTLPAEEVFPRLMAETREILTYMTPLIAVHTVNEIPSGGKSAVLHAFRRGGYSAKARDIWAAMPDGSEVKGEMALDWLWSLYEDECWTWQDFDRGCKL